MKKYILITLLFAVAVLAAGEKMTLANYMGWYAPTVTGKGLVTPYDFSILPLTWDFAKPFDADEFAVSLHRKEMIILQRHGWNTFGADGLFYNHASLQKPEIGHNINRQLQLMKYVEKAAAAIPGNQMTMIPYLEYLAAYRQLGSDKAVEFFNASLDLMVKECGQSPVWRRQDGRLIVMFYVNNYIPAEFWQKVIAESNRKGHNLFWIMELGGLQPALTGDFDLDQNRPYLELFDGVYNFGNSSLLEGATFPAKLRQKATGLKAAKYLGGTLWPGYLSDRPYNRNFISHDGTKLLRQVWEKTGSANVDFLHWVANDYKEATTLLPSFSTLTSRLEIAERFLADYNGHKICDVEPGVPQSVLSYRKALSTGEPLMLEFLPLPAENTIKSGNVKITLLSEQDKVLAEHASPELDFTMMKDYRWTDAYTADRKASRVIKVRVTLTASDGNVFTYQNLPDIAVVTPRNRLDQLFYSIPLHRLAGPEQGVVLRINGKAVNASYYEGNRLLSWSLVKPQDGAMYSICRSGHALQRMSLPDTGGSLDVTPGQAGRNFQLFKQPPRQTLLDSQVADAPNGEEYYQVLTLLPDGKYAYSPTIWCKPYFAADEVWAEWIFVPGWQTKPVRIVDRSGGGFDLDIPENVTRWPFVNLNQIDGRALEFQGDLVLTPSMESVPYGPMSMEIVFKVESLDKGAQFLTYQRGEQATLLIDENGCLTARRLPQDRRHPNPWRDAKSTEKLTPGKWYHSVVTYDAKMLRLYVNGKLAAETPCNGTRSSEGFFIGGLPAERDAVTDGGTGRFFGQMLRLTILGRELNEKEIGEIYRRFAILGLR